MRIISGKYRGKKLFSPASDEVRPTADRARESVFNILNGLIEDWAQVRILDVFCGTGAFGLEAISRGAASACLLDIDTGTALKNFKLFEGEKEKIQVVKADVRKKLTLPSPRREYKDTLFNLVFLDAPYCQGLSEVALQNLFAGGWIGDNALIIVELEKNEEINLDSMLKIDDTRVYGAAKFLFLTKISS